MSPNLDCGGVKSVKVRSSLISQFGFVAWEPLSLCLWLLFVYLSNLPTQPKIPNKPFVYKEWPCATIKGTTYPTLNTTH